MWSGEARYPTFKTIRSFLHEKDPAFPETTNQIGPVKLLSCFHKFKLDFKLNTLITIDLIDLLVKWYG
jgi:hypothetical protein